MTWYHTKISFSFSTEFYCRTASVINLPVDVELLLLPSLFLHLLLIRALQWSKHRRKKYKKKTKKYKKIKIKWTNNAVQRSIRWNGDEKSIHFGGHSFVILIESSKVLFGCMKITGKIATKVTWNWCDTGWHIKSRKMFNDKQHYCENVFGMRTCHYLGHRLYWKTHHHQKHFIFIRTQSHLQIYGT